MANRRKNMIIRSYWTKKNEYEDIISCLEGNNRDELFDIIFKIKERGDL